jgi:hypothetical protein
MALILAALADVEAGRNAPLHSQDEVRAWEFRMLMLRRLQWSICVLHGGRAGTLTDVHQSFIKKEIAGVDSRTATWGMPTGVGTVCLAARVLQASGGTVEVMGSGTTGHDIRWAPATGGLALIERKDRTYEVGIDEPLGLRIRHLIGKIREAGPKLPSAPGAARILAVGFPGFVAANKAKRTRARFEEELGLAFGNRPRPEENPDYLIVDFVGSQHALTGGYDMKTFSHVIDFGFERPDWKAVAGAFRRAYTVVGRHEPGPWPIIAL